MIMNHVGDKGVGAIEDILKVKVETDDRQNFKRKFTSTTAELPTIDEENDFCEVKRETVKTEEHKDYTKTIHNVEEPKLITIRGISQAFLDARRSIAKILRRGNLQTAGLKVNGIQFKVLNMQDKQFSLEADIETIDEHGEKGKSKLTIYKDNKKKAGKKEQTIMMTKKARHEAKHVNTLSLNIIQYLLEGFINNCITDDDVQKNI